MRNCSRDSCACSARRVFRLLAAAATGVLAVAGVAVPAAAATSSPEQVLQRAKAFAERAKSVEFTATLEFGGAIVGTLEQAAVLPKRGRSVLTRGADIVDRSFVKDQAFVRESPQGAPVEGFPYVPQYGHPKEYLAFERPQDIAKIVSFLKDPEIVSEGADGTVVRGTFKEPDKLSVGPANPTAAHLDLVVAPDGEPKSFTLVASGPDGELIATADDVTWNGRVTVPTPKNADLVDEDAVSQFVDAPLYRPKTLPRRWKLELAQVFVAAQTVEGCAQVETAYVDPESRRQDFLDIFEFPTPCASPDPLELGEPLTLGSYQGTIRDVFGEPLRAQFDVDGTTVQVHTSLSREEFEKVLGELVPLDFDKAPNASHQPGRNPDVIS